MLFPAPAIHAPCWKVVGEQRLVLRLAAHRSSFLAQSVLNAFRHASLTHTHTHTFVTVGVVVVLAVVVVVEVE